MMRHSRMIQRWRVILCAVLTLITAQPAAGDVVERRGSEPKLEGKIRQIDDVGVTIVSSTGGEHVVTWDRVRSVEKDPPDPKVEQMRELATNLWRARSRLERGDAALAEPLFERLFAEYRGRSHETALIVAEGMLRCRLARGANEHAVIAAMEVSRLRRKGVRTIAYAGLPAVYDEATSLCTCLPPFWVNSAALARLDLELNAYDAAGDTAVAALKELYRAAVRQTVGLPEEPLTRLASDQPGVALLTALIEAGSSSEARRASARQALEKRLADLPGWAAAWARYAIGASLLRESGVGRQQAGMVSLAHLPAIFQREEPYLAALALAQMTAALAQHGDGEAAAALRAELQRLFPSHPALAALEHPESLLVPPPATDDDPAFAPTTQPAAGSATTKDPS